MNENKQSSFVLYLIFALILALPMLVAVGQPMFVTAVHASMAGPGDPCADASTAKLSAAITAGGKIVAGTAGKATYVCAIYATLAGTTPTLQVQDGTGTNCGSNTVNRTGAFAPSPNGTEFFLGDGSTVLVATTGADLCATLTGSGAGITGLIDYVQQ